MSAPLWLILFDMEGILVNSQGSIVAAMTICFEWVSLSVPDRVAIQSIIGLSLPQLMVRLAPEEFDTVRNRLVEGYKQACHARRLAQGAASSLLYPEARGVIESLNGQVDILLGVAAGKPQCCQDALLEAHGLDRYFITRQVADHHPSKTHPSMIEAALAETGVVPQQAVSGDGWRYQL